MERVFIIGTGLIGASTGLALRGAGFAGRIDGWDTSSLEMAAAVQMGAIDGRASNRDDALELARLADVIVLAVPVLAIKDWMQQLAPVLRANQLVTDVGSTKVEIVELAERLFVEAERASFLPGHPMAGKESGGALLAEAGLFDGAIWLFTPTSTEMAAMEKEWRGGGEIAAIGGRALKETTRLGASPYSMWRDVALTNTGPVADTLLALEQRLQHVRENLRTPELRDEFALANRFRQRR